MSIMSRTLTYAAVALKEPVKSIATIIEITGQSPEQTFDDLTVLTYGGAVTHNGIGWVTKPSDEWVIAPRERVEPSIHIRQRRTLDGEFWYASRVVTCDEHPQWRGGAGTHDGALRVAALHWASYHAGGQA